MVRVPQVTDKAALPGEYHALFDRIVRARGGVMEGPYSVLLHSPAVAAAVEGLAPALRTQSELQEREFVLAALAVARAKDCLFVWAVQAGNARRAGIPEPVIAAVRERAAGALGAEEAGMVAYARQLAGGTRVDGETFERLRERHGARWLVELTVTVGNFELFAAVCNAFEVPPPAGGDLLPV